MSSTLLRVWISLAISFVSLTISFLSLMRRSKILSVISASFFWLSSPWDSYASSLANVHYFHYLQKLYFAWQIVSLFMTQVHASNALAIVYERAIINGKYVPCLGRVTSLKITNNETNFGFKTAEMEDSFSRFFYENKSWSTNKLRLRRNGSLERKGGSCNRRKCWNRSWHSQKTCQTWPQSGWLCKKGGTNTGICIFLLCLVFDNLSDPYQTVVYWVTSQILDRF